MALITALPPQTPAQPAEPPPHVAGLLVVHGTFPGSTHNTPVLRGVLGPRCVSSVSPGGGFARALEPRGHAVPDHV